MAKTLIIIPTYNEQENIGNLVDRLAGLPLQPDVLVVDDGSDQTAEIIREKQKQKPNVFLIKREGKGGRGTAVLEGLRFGLEKNYDFLVEMDADFSHQPDELPEMMEKAGPNTLVIASRYLSGSRIENWPITRKIFSRFANIYANLVLGIGIHDYTNGYRVYGREAIQKLDMERIQSKGYIVLSEISYQLFKKGVSFAETKTLFINRSRGASNFSWREIKEAFTAVWRIRGQYKQNP